MMALTGAGAALAGLVSFFSPCVLPLVPGFMAFVTGASGAELAALSRAERVRRVGPRALAFVAGLGTVFVALGASATTIGRALSTSFDTLAMIGGVALAILGLHMLGLVKVPLLIREWRLGERLRPDGPGGAYLVGLAFGFGWTPCVGPILAAILLVAAQRDSALEGAGLLAAYAVGMGAPFLAIALFQAELAGRVSRAGRHLWLVEKAAGAVILVTGALIATGLMGRVATWLYEAVPLFQSIG
jgi:cytochrome c-type biogenesis protein